MKKFVLLLGCLLITLVVFGQDRSKGNKKEKVEQIKAHKIAYLTTELSLTEAEAQRFWPVYNDFSKKRMALQKEKRDCLKALANKDGQLKEEQQEVLLDKMIKLKMQHAELDMQYHQKFKGVLPIAKVAKLYKAEHEFKNKLLKQMRDYQGRGHKASGDHEVRSEHEGFPPPSY